MAVHPKSWGEVKTGSFPSITTSISTHRKPKAWGFLPRNKISRLNIRYQVSGIRYRVSGIRYQVSAINHQLSAKPQLSIS